MSQLERIFKRISETPTKKETLKKALIKGFTLTKIDRQNLQVMLKRMGVRFTKATTNNQLLRLYLNAQYKEQIKLQKLAKDKKKAEQLAQAKIKRMVDIMEKAKVERTKKTSMGSHYVKLVK